MESLIESPKIKGDREKDKKFFSQECSRKQEGKQDLSENAEMEEKVVNSYFLNYLKSY